MFIPRIKGANNQGCKNGPSKARNPPRLSLWDRKSSSNRTSPGRFQNQAASAVGGGGGLISNTPRPKSETRAFGSGPGPGYTAVQSQPGSPMQEQSPLYWFVRDIDIGDSSSTKSAGPHRTNPNLPRTRSRHDCHFSLGSACLGGGGRTGGGGKILSPHHPPTSSVSSSQTLILLQAFKVSWHEYSASVHL